MNCNIYNMLVRFFQHIGDSFSLILAKISFKIEPNTKTFSKVLKVLF